MELAFANLIRDYQKQVSYAVKILRESGIEMPYSSHEWTLRTDPREGKLVGGVSYQRHGRGIWLDLPDGQVDFDFGDQGETTGFDRWRLECFLDSRRDAYPTSTRPELGVWLKDGIIKGELIQAPYGLYYVADIAISKNQDVNRILTDGCGLPHQSQDRILTLYSECFLSADVMLGHYNSTVRYAEKHKGLSRLKRIGLRVYLLSWLGYLHSTMEGIQSIGVRLLLQRRRHHSFQEAIPLLDELNSLFKKHANSLRILRNNVFHLLTDANALEAFFSQDGQRLRWATELHRQLAEFFSDYRITAEVYYLETGRMAESVVRSVARERKRRRSTTMPTSEK